MTAAISPAALKKRGTGNLSWEQIKELQENPERFDKLVSTLEGHVAAANEAEKAAMTRLQEADTAEALIKQERAALATETSNLGTAKDAFETHKENIEATLRTGRETLDVGHAQLATDTEEFEAEKQHFERDASRHTAEMEQRQNAMTQREDAATQHEADNATAGEALDARSEEFNSAAVKIAGIAGKLVKE